MTYYRNVEECRVCESSNLKKVMEFDGQYIASTFVQTNENNEMSGVKIPLTLMLCERCGLVQLLETVSPDLLYQNYFYRTAVNDTMRRDLKEVVEETIELGSVRSGDYVVDIGANDCTTISMFPDDLIRIGVEPAKNISWDHVDDSIVIVNDYFSKEAVFERTSGNRVKAITATAMFYDLDNPNAATQDIKSLLAEDGVCTIQVSNLYHTIIDMNFYDICHEHLEYYCLRTINYLMEKNDLSIFDASHNAVNGGSLRINVAHREMNRPKSDRYHELLGIEDELALSDVQTYETYAASIESLSRRSREFIEKETENGRLVIGLGASTKGNVLLQLCGIGKELLPFIGERNPEKVGLRTMGTDIELISERAARELKPSCMLVIPWNFKDEIIKRESEYIASGGKLLFLMPYPYYVDVNGETAL